MVSLPQETPDEKRRQGSAERMESGHSAELSRPASQNNERAREQYKAAARMV